MSRDRLAAIVYFTVAVPGAILLHHQYDVFVAFGFMVLWAFTILGIFGE